MTAVAVAMLAAVLFGGPMPSPAMMPAAPTPSPTPAPTFALPGAAANPTATSSLPAFSSMLAMQQPSSAMAPPLLQPVQPATPARRAPVKPYSEFSGRLEISPELLAAYQASNTRSKAYVEGARRRPSDNRNIANFCLPYKEACHPIVGRAAAPRGSGHVVDADGNWLLDLEMAAGAIAFGHNPPFVRNAVVGMMRRGEWAVAGPMPLLRATPRSSVDSPAWSDARS